MFFLLSLVSAMSKEVERVVKSEILSMECNFAEMRKNPFLLRTCSGEKNNVIQLKKKKKTKWLVKRMNK